MDIVMPYHNEALAGTTQLNLVSLLAQFIIYGCIVVDEDWSALVKTLYSTK